MCLLKVYVEDAGGCQKTLIANNVMHVSADEGAFKILDIEGGEKNISGVSFLMIDALNSVLVLRVVEEEVKIKG